MALPETSSVPPLAGDVAGKNIGPIACLVGYIVYNEFVDGPVDRDHRRALLECHAVGTSRKRLGTGCGFSFTRNRERDFERARISVFRQHEISGELHSLLRGD